MKDSDDRNDSWFDNFLGPYETYNDYFAHCEEELVIAEERERNDEIIYGWHHDRDDDLDDDWDDDRDDDRDDDWDDDRDDYSGGGYIPYYPSSAARKQTAAAAAQPETRPEETAMEKEEREHAKRVMLIGTGICVLAIVLVITGVKIASYISNTAYIY